MSSSFGEYMVSRVVSSDTRTEKLENKVRVMLDDLSDHVQLPFGMVLEGVITNDRHGNKSLYVFLKDGGGTRFPGRDLRWNNSPDRIEEAVDGKWISLNDRGLNSFNAEFEARDLKAAAKHHRLGLLTEKAVREHYRNEEAAERLAAIKAASKEQK